jgi:N-acyl-D-amino-acid deacylase
LGTVNVLKDPVQREEIKEWNRKRRTGDLSWVQISSCRAFPQYEGLRIPEIARQMGVDEYEAVFNLIVGSNDNANACYFTMCEEDVETVMAHPRAMICTDSGVARNNAVFHPRLKASFPRALGHYVRERKVISFEEAIRRMTSMPAALYGLTGKGMIRVGYDADLCLMDPDTIIDAADYKNWNARCPGLKHVFVAGEPVVTDSVHDGRLLGKKLLRSW